MHLACRRSNATLVRETTKQTCCVDGGDASISFAERLITDRLDSRELQHPIDDLLGSRVLIDDVLVLPRQLEVIIHDPVVAEPQIHPVQVSERRVCATEVWAVVFFSPSLHDVEGEVALADVVLAFCHQPHGRVDVLVHGGTVAHIADEGNLFHYLGLLKGVRREERLWHL